MTRTELEEMAADEIDAHLLKLQERARELRVEEREVAHQIQLTMYVLGAKMSKLA